jgi:cell division protein FtsZ
MRSGGVAILGSAAVSGENRAQKAIEEALNSPLLNDNDIRGAKWILININSSEGEHEFTMDEVDIIQSCLIGQAGEHTDVILGLGYDNSLGDNIGITLIATGFEHRDPFTKREEKKPEPKKEEKVVMTLGITGEEKKLYDQPRLQFEEAQKPAAPAYEPVLPKELAPKMMEVEESASPIVVFTKEEPRTFTVDKKEERETIEFIYSSNSEQISPKKDIRLTPEGSEKDSPLSAVSGGYLAKPSNIYAEPKSPSSNPEHIPVKEPIFGTGATESTKEEEPSFDMQLVLKDDIPAADAPLAHQTLNQNSGSFSAEEPALQDEAEEQKRRAAERIQKLRNLSFNINAADPNNEFETVPAYIRRNLELYNTISPAQDFYSNYEVKPDGNNGATISTLNTFLDGKKPD